MKALLLRTPWICSGGFLALLGWCSLAVHPFGRVKRAESQESFLTDLHVSPEAASLLNRACMDCHSNQTEWPWYSYVAPVSWLVERDVSRGRDRVNFSKWREYTFKDREKLLADIATAVKNREMPLAQYARVHRAARLSDADTDVLYAWARAERRKLKGMRAHLFPQVPGADRNVKCIPNRRNKKDLRSRNI